MFPAASVAPDSVREIRSGDDAVLPVRASGDIGMLCPKAHVTPANNSQVARQHIAHGLTKIDTPSRIEGTAKTHGLQLGYDCSCKG